MTNGLIRNGHCVWDFSYRDTAHHLAPLGFGKKLGTQRMNDYLLAVARQFNPDLILLGHCELLMPTTLAALKDCLPTCKIAQWWVDLFPKHKLPHLRAKQPYLDAFFATMAPEYYSPLIAVTQSPPLYYLPNIVDSSIETGRAFAAKQHNYDVFFIGSNALERKNILQCWKIFLMYAVGFSVLATIHY
ncbi:hypothetical protein NQX30_01325 [Candidatus Persebacteraceae bacterium Df01]|jgi:hypothetical protein|uniref:Uncharacterized protein n=1 Tax=Candidatus Doriopsillibacter californiensis TaxID=2970740 RepID=A0ABT7QJZ9_9GAMM|nr:hypothetical protein [Candidatus Persebacteraceae bacterium Df01]